MGQKPTEVKMKRHPKAVVMITCERGKVPDASEDGYDFEWFNGGATGTKAMTAYFDQVREFDKSDAKDHDDMAYLTVEVTDTATAPMTFGRIEVSPENEATGAWVQSVKDNPALIFPVKPVEKDAEAPKPTGRKVRARRQSSAAQQVQTADPKVRAGALKERLAAKKTAEKKSETGDPPPKKVVPKKPTAKKAAAGASAEAAANADA